MNKSKFFTVTVFAEFDPNNLKEIPQSNGFMFSIPKIIEPECFFVDGNQGVPNKQATQLISSMLVEALSGNIHTAHQKGQYDSAAHLRAVINQLENLFVANCDVHVGFEDIFEFIRNKKK